MLNRSTPIPEPSLRGLHPRSIDDAESIRALLERARRSHCVLHRGLNTMLDREVANIDRIERGNLVLKAENFDKTNSDQVFLNFLLSGRPYFFATAQTAGFDGNELTVRIPKTIYYSERRDRMRRSPDFQAGDPRRITISSEAGWSAGGVVRDVSPEGIGIEINRCPAVNEEDLLRVEFLDGRDAGKKSRVQLRNHRPLFETSGWTRLGLVRTDSDLISRIPIEYREAILDNPIRPQGPIVDQGAAEPSEPRVLRMSNESGEEIVGLMDSWGSLQGATAVVIPNGWGQTKEALLPLARTIVATFQGCRLPVCVVRFDGIRKRGESHNDPECRIPGHENQNFAFSQGVDDIESVVRFLRESPGFQASSVVLVSFSAAAIEARKALARDYGKAIDGWISIVGSPDVQSMARSISGGIDFVLGYERGMRFGLQELLGVLVDIDRITADGEANDLLFIEDSRRDFSKISAPISWYHGKFDAWVDLERVRDVLSHGDTTNRLLQVIPTGHQLKSSRQASEVFQSIAKEIARMATGEVCSPHAADATEVRRLRVAERDRLPAVDIDLRKFWRDYLIGRDGSFGIELLASGTAYSQMMEEQALSLSLSSGDRLLDLGSGTGAFEVALSRSKNCPPSISVISVDYVREALCRARARMKKSDMPPCFEISYIDVDLNLIHPRQSIPFVDESIDAVIASLLLGYLDSPELILGEIFRLLRPGGRLSASSLLHDADFSSLYAECTAELRLGIAKDCLPELDQNKLGDLSRNFLNDAAKILDFEESGAFRFWDPEDLESLIARAGFVEIETSHVLGIPRQAFLVSATKPSQF